MLDQCFLTGEAHLPRGASINFKGGATPCALCNMDSFINKLTDKYICLHKFFVFKGA